MYRQYTTYIKTKCNNYNYYLGVCCVSTVHNILYKFDIHKGMTSLKNVLYAYR